MSAGGPQLGGLAPRSASYPTARRSTGSFALPENEGNFAMSPTPKLVALLAAAAVALTGCSSGSSDSGATNEGGLTTLELWTHNGGNDDRARRQQEGRRRRSTPASPSTRSKLQSFPQASYNDAVTAAASAKKLPCVLDIDGPNVPNWAWAGYLQPLDMPDGFFDKQLPSTVGKVDGKVYSFGHYDVAMSMIARKSVLEQYGIRIPTLDQPWTGDEFDAAVAKIKAGGTFAFPLDMGTAGTGEWAPYAYSPLLQSFGGDLVEPRELPERAGCAERSGGARVGNLVPRPGRPRDTPSRSPARTRPSTSSTARPRSCGTAAGPRTR